MDRERGVCSRDRVFVSALPAAAAGLHIAAYSVDALPAIAKDSPEDGFSVIIMPSGSSAHTAYAHDAASYQDIFLNAIVGWISGVHLKDLGPATPQVVNGLSGAWSSEQVVAMHVPLRQGYTASIDIVNVFQPGTGETFHFPKTGFEASECLIDGEAGNFTEYLDRTQADVRLPLTADYNGSIINDRRFATAHGSPVTAS